MKIKVVMIIFLVSFFSCKQVKGRRPILRKTTILQQEVINQHKVLNSLENKKIKQWIAKDSTHVYINSSKGFWYTYIHKKKKHLPFPKTGDIAIIQYDIKSLDGTVIYSKKELGIKKYRIDKQDFIAALQDGIKLMKKGETITFIIPSYRGFGIVGDQNKIGINKTLKSTVTLINIKKDEN